VTNRERFLRAGEARYALRQAERQKYLEIIKARKETVESLAWWLNELLSLLYEVHVEGHMTGDGMPVVGCEACIGWKRGRDFLRKTMEEAITAASDSSATP
jgi:hypothetical protein